MKLEFPGAVPEIPVRDINEAAAYYENNLGFTVDWGGEELGLAGIKGKLCCAKTSSKGLSRSFSRPAGSRALPREAFRRQELETSNEG